MEGDTEELNKKARYRRGYRRTEQEGLDGRGYRITQ